MRRYCIISISFIFSFLFIFSLENLEAQNYERKYYAQEFRNKKKKKFKDRDGDGVPDHEDLCPDVPGSPLTNGCPDRDGDGVPDHEDLCPDIPGSPLTKGCPDSDGDGVADFEDDCPDIPGEIRYNGCPDSDGDGIPDNKDVCPYKKGPIENNGCPLTVLEQPVATIRSKTKQNVEEDNIEDIDSSTFDYNTTLSSPHYKVTEYYIVPEVLPDNTKINIQYSKSNNKNQNQDKKDTLIVEKPVDVVDIKKTNEIKVPSKYSIIPKEYNKLKNIVSNISFEWGRIIMNDNSYIALGELAEILLKNSDWKLIIHCYSNEADSNFRNLQLSENRAIAIKSYLSKQNINSSRITSKGYGNNGNLTNTTESYIILEIN